MSYELSWEPAGAHIIYSGEVTEQDCLQSVTDMYNDARSDSAKYQIADFSGATDIQFTRLTIKVISEFDETISHWNPDVRVAMVGNPAILSELSEVYAEMIAESDWDFRTFESLDAAREWVRSS